MKKKSSFLSIIFQILKIKFGLDSIVIASDEFPRAIRTQSKRLILCLGLALLCQQFSTYSYSFEMGKKLLIWKKMMDWRKKNCN